METGSSFCAEPVRERSHEAGDHICGSERFFQTLRCNEVDLLLLLLPPLLLAQQRHRITNLISFSRPSTRAGCAFFGNAFGSKWLPLLEREARIMGVRHRLDKIFLQDMHGTLARKRSVTRWLMHNSFPAEVCRELLDLLDRVGGGCRFHVAWWRGPRVEQDDGAHHIYRGVTLWSCRIG